MSNKVTLEIKIKHNTCNAHSHIYTQYQTYSQSHEHTSPIGQRS